LYYDGSTWSSILSISEWTNSIWGSSSTDVFGACLGGTILHYNGDKWSDMLIPAITTTTSKTTSTKTTTTTTFTNPYQYDDFYGVWGSSSSDVFIVGGSHFTGETIIIHYNGKTWSTMTSNATSELYGVWGTSSSDVFAVGFTGTILHYDGKKWSAMTSNTTYDLLSIWGVSSSDIFAVGNGGIILHYGH
jgi:predicted membrane protein